ncbi:MAG: heterodisulfide reductase subunit A-like protein [Thermoanaerobacteraceae bacterium]|nr:heterodisulfide reductase subunit A-like protein [Thermoanaerobacteraceae bacterium]
MEEKQLPGFIMCVCTGKCPGFQAMDIWDFINQVRVELPVEYAFIHPQLCEEDGDRFLADFLKARRKVIIGACAPNMQRKMFKQAFKDAGLDIEKDTVMLDIRDMTNEKAIEVVKNALKDLGLEEE